MSAARDALAALVHAYDHRFEGWPFAATVAWRSALAAGRAVLAEPEPSAEAAVLSSKGCVRFPAVPEPLAFVTPTDLSYLTERIGRFRGRNYNIKTTVFLDQGASPGSATEPLFTFSQLSEYARGAIELSAQGAKPEPSAEPIVIIGDTFQLLWVGFSAETLRRNGLKVGSKLYAAPTTQAKPAAEVLAGLAWAVERWESEVKYRPLVNIHRRYLDDSWRQMIRYFGGDPVALVGPAHDDLLIANPIPPDKATTAELTDAQVQTLATKIYRAVVLLDGVDAKDRADKIRCAVRAALKEAS